MSSSSTCVVAVTLLAASFLSSPVSLAGGTTPAPTSAASEGRRLFRAGQFAPAASKLEAAIGTSNDPELLFELAVCYERLGRDPEAIAAFRAYKRLPIALRSREADQQVQAIESKQPAAAGAAAAAKPRHVLVPVDSDQGKCLKDCAPVPAQCGRQPKCWAIQFACLRSCPGAKVAPGSCLAVSSDSGQKCVNDGWP